LSNFGFFSLLRTARRSIPETPEIAKEENFESIQQCFNVGHIQNKKTETTAVV
jgi:hypothetical protein